MSGALRRSVWLRHLGVSLIYALGYVLLRQVSLPHWMLIAGYDLSVLAMVPYRYWPALAIGEIGPLVYASFACLDTFGALWAGLMLVPPIVMAMPVVKICRDRFKMIRPQGQAHIGEVLMCALVVSLLWTGANVLILACAHLPAGAAPIDYAAEAGWRFIGNYLGILTITPLVLLVREAWAIRLGSLAGFVRRILRSRLLRESLLYLLPAMAMLLTLALTYANQAIGHVACLAIFIPVVGFALRHGWHGAAIGGTVASIGIVLTMPGRDDSITLHAEVVTILAASCMLLLGSRITAPRQRSHQHRDDSTGLALRINAQSEVQLRQTSQAIELISETMHSTEELMFEQLRKLWPAVNSSELRRRVNVTREQLWQLSDGLYPLALRKRGLLEAMREGAIARALGAREIDYGCLTQGDIEQLSEPMQIAVHRLANEAVCHTCAMHSVSGVTLQVRGGRFGGRRWVLLRVSARFSNDPKYRLLGVPLNYRLGATGLGLSAIEDRAMLYDGTVRVRSRAQGELISILVHEPTALATAQAESPWHIGATMLVLR